MKWWLAVRAKKGFGCDLTKFVHQRLKGFGKNRSVKVALFALVLKTHLTADVLGTKSKNAPCVL